SQYRQVWKIHGAGRLGALRVTELPTSRTNAHIQAVAMRSASQAGYLRIILRGMFSMAVRFDVLDGIRSLRPKPRSFTDSPHGR
ncbi:MAG TPA: hypothetical protein VKA66_14270, partial [Mycobacterium sp.]|nr:hypothetical protein [Mycobacterium sp.]